MEEIKLKEEKYPYIKKEKIMTETELSFYQYLKQILDESHTIFTQVRMEDIIQVPKGIKDEWSWRGKIKSRHIDFVICDAKTGKIQRAIELNDPTHYKKKRKERDEFVNKAFKSAGIKLLIMKPKEVYTRQDIEKLFYS